jgi:hypothetical protein
MKWQLVAAWSVHAKLYVHQVELAVWGSRAANWQQQTGSSKLAAANWQQQTGSNLPNTVGANSMHSGVCIHALQPACGYAYGT